jgi:hypothetical protein
MVVLDEITWQPSGVLDVSSLNSLDVAGGTPAGRYLRWAPGILVAVPNAGYVQTEEGARRSLLECDRIAKADGRKQAVVILVDHVLSQDARSRRVWSTARSAETRCAQALVCNTLLARAIGSFFLGLTRAHVPTHMFAELQQAAAWAQEMLDLHGGPVE